MAALSHAEHYRLNSSYTQDSCMKLDLSARMMPSAVRPAVARLKLWHEGFAWLWVGTGQLGRYLANAKRLGFISPGVPYVRLQQSEIVGTTCHHND